MERYQNPVTNIFFTFLYNPFLIILYMYQHHGHIITHHHSCRALRRRGTKISVSLNTQNTEQRSAMLATRGRKLLLGGSLSALGFVQYDRTYCYSRATRNCRSFVAAAFTLYEYKVNWKNAKSNEERSAYVFVHKKYLDFILKYIVTGFMIVWQRDGMMCARRMVDCT